MNKFVGHDLAARRAGRACLILALLASLTIMPAGAASLRESYLISTGGQAIQFDVAADEIHVVGADGVGDSRLIPRQANADAVVAEAERIAGQLGGAANLVLYPRGVEKNKFSQRIVTKSVLVRLHPDANAPALAASVGAGLTDKISYAPGYRVFTVEGAGAALRLAEELAGKAGVLSSTPLLATWKEPLLIPNDTYFTNQWHLLNTGQSNAAAGIDINVTDVWETYTGRGITLSVVDTGVQVGHPDLLLNANTAIDYDYNFNDADPSPSQGFTDAHGTSVAGVAAGVGNNGIGIAGVAFNSSIVGLRFLSGPTPDTITASVLQHSNQVVHVSNNSWGPVLFGVFLGGPGPLAEAALLDGVTNGRGGLGSIFVFAAGNGDLDFENVNYNGFANSIHTIAVGALDNVGEKADYSNRGAALVVSAPSGGEVLLGGRGHATTTTDTVGAAGFNSGGGNDLADADYTEIFNGTSSAAPVVTGVIALMLEANPGLGWRDVQEILMQSAVQTDFFDNDWVFNGAGFHFNHKYGAGRVDAEAAVNLAQTWTNLPEQVVISGLKTNLNLAIPDLAPNGVSVSFDISASDFRAEHVAVTIDTTHSFAGDLEIKLTSPDGTESRLAERDFTPLFDYNGWTLMTVRNWGELAEGTWTLQVADRGFGGVGALDFAKLEIWGSSTNVIPDLLISDVNVQEGDDGITEAKFDVTLSQPVSSFLNVDYATGGAGTATPNVDYTSTSGTLIFSPGQTNLTITVPVIGDLLEEQNETFYVSIFNSSEVQIVDETGLGTILNDDGPVWTIGDVSIEETDTGTTNAVFNLMISETSTNTVSVEFFTVDGSATAGLDYTATNGTITLLPGATMETVSVEILGDALLETNETFSVTLTNALMSSILKAEGVGTILDDEPRIQVAALSVVEGNAGFHDVIVDVTLTKPGLFDIQVDYATTNLTARSDGDYTAVSGTLTFLVGVTNQIITVPVGGDLLYETDETFGIRLMNATNGAVVSDLTEITILNDDTAPRLSVLDNSVSEGSAGTNVLTLTVELDAPSGLAAAVDFVTSPGTASVGIDYQANSGTLIFQPGVTSRTVDIGIFGDVTHEQDESFGLTLLNARGSTILTGSGMGTILNDDSSPAVTISDLQVTEGDLGAVSALVSLTLSHASGLPVTIDYSTSLNPGAGDPAEADDFTPIPGGQLIIPAGDISATIAVTVIGDAGKEGNESFLLNVDSASNATIADNQAEVTIINDDGPILSISGETVTEGDSGTITAIVTIMLSEISLDVVTVDISTVDGSATAAGGDYQAVASKPVTFFSGQTSATETFTINGDTDLESDESFEVVLSNEVNATVSNSRTSITIIDDDTKSDLAVSVSGSPAGAFLGREFTYTLGLTNAGPYGATNIQLTVQPPANATFVSSTPAANSTNPDGSLNFSVGNLAENVFSNVVDLIVIPANLSDMTLTAAVSADQPDVDTLNNMVANVASVATPTVIVSSGFAFNLISESRTPANGSIDPGETVTLALSLRNTGNVAATDILATLNASGGVTSPSVPQSYGALAAANGAATRTFTFTADPSVTSGAITLTVDLVDATATGNVSHGQISAMFDLPATHDHMNAAAISAPDVGSAPVSEIQVSGLAGTVVDTVTVVLHGVTHAFPTDLDVLLVGPNNVGVVLMSDAGRHHPLSGVDLNFSDSASRVLSRIDPITAGTYRPTDYIEKSPADDYTIAGAPAGPYFDSLSAFSGIAPNGVWSLYVIDDVADYAGQITGGWSLMFDTVSPVSTSAGLSAVISSDKNPATFGDSLTYTITIHNDGPATANNISLSGDFADGINVQGVALLSVPTGSLTTSSTDPIAVSLPTLLTGQSAAVTVDAVVNSVGALTNTVTVAADEFDLNPANNAASAITISTRPVMLMSSFIDNDPGNGFRIMLQGVDEVEYVIEVSSDLIHWTPIGEVNAGDGEIDFNDTNASGAVRRFYRAVKR